MQPSRRKQKRQAGELVFSYVISCQKSDGAFNLIGTEASCTDVDMAGRTIDDCFHALYIGLPSSVGASVRVRDFNAERNALAANIALCQLLHLQSLRKSSKTRRRNTPLHILAEFSRKSKRKNAKNKIFLRMVALAAQIVYNRSKKSFGGMQYAYEFLQRAAENRR